MANYDMDKLVLAGFDGEHVDDTFTMEGVKIDNTLSVTGRAADAKKTGDEIGALKEDLDYLINVKRFTKVNQNAQIYEYSFVKGVEYTVSNKSASGAVWLRTCTSDGTEIDAIYYEMASGTSVIFIPSQDANYFRIYSGDVAERVVEINTYGEVTDDIYSRLESAEKEVDILAETGERYKNWQVYRKPEGFTIDLPLTIYTDGYSYVTDYDKEDHKNTSANIWYVSPTGNNSNTGKFPVQALKTFSSAYTRMASGDTVVLMEGDYDRDNDTAVLYQKSVNIIGEGKVRIFNGNFSPFSAVSGYSNVYKATRTYGERVYEVDTVGDDICRLTLVDSIESVESTEGSYYKTGNDFYVHPIKSGTPNATGGARIFISLNYDDLFSANNQDQDVKFYLENVTIVGSAKSCRYDRVSSSNSLDVCLDNVRFVWCGSENRNAVELFGGNLFLNGCSVHGSYRDGFNYCGTDTSGSTLRDNCIVEINCFATDCGFERTETNMNASTAHRNSKVIRVNGYYSECHGANCADVQEYTESINLGCVAFNSGSVDGYNGGFSAQQAGTKMWLENCIAIGSLYDVSCANNAELTMNRCTYDTKQENGTITETNHVPVSVWMIKNKENIK